MFIDSLAARRWAALAAVLSGPVLLAGCGGDDNDNDTTPVVRPVPDAASLRTACSTLTGRTVAAAEIGLPSAPATVSAATLVPATTGTAPTPEYCRVNGSIAPTAAGADPIVFQINLPLTWNEKAVMVGGGGFNGSLVNSLAPLRDAPAGQPLAITQGYAMFATDSGHDAAAYNTTDPGKFALNDEMLVNFAHASYKKVKDVAHSVMAGYYLRKPAKQYYYGGSEGGREGLMMAQRYPADFDGIVSVVPVIYWTGLFNGFINYSKPQFTGGALSTAKISAFAKTVNDTCDALDGVADGVVSNYLACASKMNLASLRCVAGADTGPACLSDPQLATLQATYGPTVLPFAVANGSTTYPGRLFGGEIQLGGEGIGRWISTGAVPTVPAPLATDARGVIYGSSYARYLIARDANFDVRTFNASAFEARIKAVSELMDASNPNLAAFRARGGKLIVRENTGDMAQSPLAGINYVQNVVTTMGQSNVDSFLRLYVSPASSHGGTAASLTTAAEVPTTYDLLGALDGWVTSGQPPADALVQVRNATTAPFTTLASRPMCRYPNYPQYVAGDVSKAESYRCAVSAP